MEKAKTRKIKKWDEIHGEYEVEVTDDISSGPEETAGVGPSISRNPMRGIEDMVEQNDNSFDGVINNVKQEPEFPHNHAKGNHRMVEKTKYIHFRVTQDEIDRIKERMEQAGMRNLSAYLLRMALYGYVIVMDMTDLKEILRLLQISGNNLNQYAKKANETGSIYREDIEEVKNSQKEILQEMRKVLDKLTALI